MSDRVRFYVDFLCPWCYLTSQWIRQLQDLGEVEVSWGLFSLELANAEEGASVVDSARGALALRTAVALRDAEGDEALGRFYAELGAAIHERGEDVADARVVGNALQAIGVPEALIDKALGDERTWATVERDHRALVERTRSFGVPTIALDDGEGPAIFGPVISEVPSDEDAVKLWRSVSWLTRYENFSELKRERTIEPDLESYRRFMAARRA